jgi:hypothetical protein
MPKAELKIEINERGDVSVIGPVQNKLVAYGMLELARDAIKDLHDRAASENRIAVVGELPHAGG